MERNFESYEDLAKNGQYAEASSEVTENQVTLKPFVPLPTLSGFPKQPNEWKKTVEQQIGGLRRTLTSVAGNVQTVADSVNTMSTKMDGMAAGIQRIEDLLNLGQQQPAETPVTYQNPKQAKSNPVPSQQGQANPGQTPQGH